MMTQPRFRRRLRDQRGITLIELLVGLIISAVLSVMVLTAWFALSQSASFSMNSNNARDLGRQAISRMAREIRDAQARTDNSEAAVARARSRWILITTTFNEVGNASPTQEPHLVLYRLYSDGELWRFEDGPDANTTIGGVDVSAAETVHNQFDLDEQENGEGARLIVKNVVNDRIAWDSNGDGTKDTPSTPVFRYSRYLDDGTIDIQPVVLGTDNRNAIVAAEMRLLVDLNPQHSPVYADLVTTAQIRNQH
jgi:prepilin-type N-terminal cleavage/methylation domain-containing protein